MTHNELRKFDLKHIIFIGRTWQDYLDMFHLTEDELRGQKVLDCPGGASTFTVEGVRRGLDVTACDVAYQMPGEELLATGLSDVEYVLAALQAQQENFRFGTRYRSVRHVYDELNQTLHAFVAHRRIEPERYVAAALPELPFADREFDLTLSGHLLFTYGDRLSYEWHLDALRELLRVTKRELRLFPLVDLASEHYVHLDSVIAWIEAQGFHVTENEAAYHFHQNANSMLCITRNE